MYSDAPVSLGKAVTVMPLYPARAVGFWEKHCDTVTVTPLYPVAAQLQSCPFTPGNAVTRGHTPVSDVKSDVAAMLLAHCNHCMYVDKPWPQRTKIFFWSSLDEPCLFPPTSL
jgi:hypothetical protein